LVVPFSDFSDLLFRAEELPHTGLDEVDVWLIDHRLVLHREGEFLELKILSLAEGAKVRHLKIKPHQQHRELLFFDGYLLTYFSIWIESCSKLYGLKQLTGILIIFQL
ncbi:MAG: hypothetical protein HWN66_22335, partial [Candidatus Helarchaeota archaeon]|nr:hypothetical protein [Candidatus Helarchaeota archaeon]